MVRIALIDDNSDFVAFLADLIAACGWEPLPYSRGSGVAEELRQEQPDAVMLDIWLEERDTGWQVLEALRSNPITRDIPVIVCSADLQCIQDRAGWLEAEGVPVLQKPFELDALEHLLEVAVSETRPAVAFSR